MSGAFDDSFAGLRVEHHPPDGPPRVLVETTMRSIATLSALRWVRRLRRENATGTVVVVNRATGRVLTTYPIDPDKP